jgi:hypothetical protein
MQFPSVEESGPCLLRVPMNVNSLDPVAASGREWLSSLPYKRQNAEPRRSRHHDVSILTDPDASDLRQVCAGSHRIDQNNSMSVEVIKRDRIRNLCSAYPSASVSDPGEEVL